VDLPRIRYTTTSDGLSLAYYIIGHGDATTVFILGLASHLELTWEVPGLRAIFVRLAGLGRLAVFDKRGLGLSERELGVGTLEYRVDDVRTIMDAAGFERANIVGISEGGSMAILFAATYPQRVERLVLVASYPWGGGEDSTAVRLAEATWGTGMYVRAAMGNTPKDPQVVERLERNIATPRAISALMRQNAVIDVRPILGDVRVPTLVINDRLDPIVPVAAGRYLARHIPGARFVEAKNGCHWGWGEHDNDEIIEEVVAFLGGERQSPGGDSGRVLATVLFTDIVGSTEQAVEMGDLEWRRRLDQYEAAARQAVVASQGRWVSFTGDGILAVFDGPGRAVACARHLREWTTEILGLATRSGLHVGEVEARGDDISGQAVHLAARIVTATAADEIWVSGVLPGLVAGSGLRFETRGAHTLKGFPGSTELFAVV
jgi:pimeloyl-ACP methyl ester carboxylesterase